MKKQWIILVAVMTAFGITACGNGDGIVINGTSAGEEGNSQSEEGELEGQETTSGGRIEIFTDDTTPAEESAAESTEQWIQETQPQTEASTTISYTPQTVGTTQAVIQPETTAAKVYKVTDVKKTMYATGSVRVRASYTTSSDILAALSKGEKVEVTGQSENGWMRVNYKGNVGYVSKDYLTETAPKPTETKAVASNQGTSQSGTTTKPPTTTGTNQSGTTTKPPTTTGTNQSGTTTKPPTTTGTNQSGTGTKPTTTTGNGTTPGGTTGPTANTGSSGTTSPGGTTGPTANTGSSGTTSPGGTSGPTANTGSSGTTSPGGTSGPTTNTGSGSSTTPGGTTSPGGTTNSGGSSSGSSSGGKNSVTGSVTSLDPSGVTIQTSSGSSYQFTWSGGDVPPLAPGDQVQISYETTSSGERKVTSVSK
ncbi:MAG: SH3 domain-containing protein [Hungatella sp.]|nr:SH3 domain-containing protein [Hungatella sp.]